jgi:hypothetical protein
MKVARVQFQHRLVTVKSDRRRFLQIEMSSNLSAHLAKAIRRRAALKTVRCQQPRNSKIAPFGKSHQISTEISKVFKSLCVIEKKQI